MLSYPPTLPLECVASVTSIIKERKVAENKALFGQCFWNVQGHAQKVLLGDSAHPAMFGDSHDVAMASTDKLEDMAEQLEELYATSPVFGDGTAEGDDVGNPALIIILQMIPILIQALKELGWIKRK